MNAPSAELAQLPSRSDPLWYKDAIIYQLHVKSFFDSNNDGIGDFPGLISKLDYIADLGVNTIWLLPFYPSPRLRRRLRHRRLHATSIPTTARWPTSSSFIAAAHARGIRVITELVINHTSDQHPWFQRARTRQARLGRRATSTSGPTPTRNTPARASSSSIPSARTGPGIRSPSAYYWHRFYSHQPDLNFDNPQVLEAVLGVMRFWLDLGVDGLRLDAVPYLVEREGTNNENLPETHEVLQAHPRRARHALSRPHAAGRSQPVAGGHQGVFRRRRRMPHGVPLPADAAHVHGAGARGPLPDHRHHAPDAADPRHLPVGDLPAQSRRADARDGDRFGARLSLADLRHRPPRAHQSRHPPPARAAARARPPPHRADELPAALDARHAGDLLRRRDRHGRQHPSRRPRRRAHADAVVARPQWRLLARRSGGAGAADHHGPALRLRDGQRRGADARSAIRCCTGCAACWRCGAATPPSAAARLRFLYPKNRKVLAYLRELDGRDDPVRRQRLAHAAGGRARPLGIRRPRAGRAERRLAVSADRPAHLPADPAALRLLLVHPRRRRARRPSWHTPAPEPMPDYVTLVLRDGLAGGAGQPPAPLLERDALPAYLHEAPLVLAPRTRRSSRPSIAYLAPLPGGEREVLLAEIEIEDRRRDHSAGRCRCRSCGTTSLRQPLPGQLALRACAAAGASAC